MLKNKQEFKAKRKKCMRMVYIDANVDDYLATQKSASKLVNELVIEYMKK